MPHQTHPDVLDILMVGGLALFLLLLPFHLVVKKLTPCPVGTYWKEILLGVLVVLWSIRYLRERRLLLTGTALDGAVLIYLGLLLLRFAWDRSGWVGAWGLYVSVLYLPLFWLVPTTLRCRPARTRVLMTLLVGVGALVALGGLAEFVLDIPLWPSDEMVQRQGFPDVYIYGTHIRRVYFTLDSPTALANTLAMLLPLALPLLVICQRFLARLTVGLAAALMAVCVIVTFSRGIWVATVVSVSVMGVLSGFVRRRWKTSLAVGGGLIALACVLVPVTQHVGGGGSTFEGVVELSPASYWTAPVTEVSRELMSTAPMHGQAIREIWSLLDPITAQDDVRLVMCQHPPQSGKDEIVYSVQVPEAGALRFAIALSPDTWSPEKGDGASFQIYVAEPDAPQEGQSVFVRYINPKHNPSDRRWRNFLVDLSQWAGRVVHVSLLTEAGPAGDPSFDRAGWAELQIAVVDPDYFASSQTDNAILRHASSITDWSRDETNRDRLVAWSLAFNAWREAPLWGQGLGSTGVAALRTQPEGAFVTESQVLKSLVELGPLGLLALAYLWFQIGRTGYRTYRAAGDPTEKMLLLGILTSLLAIFIEGWVYQNLEVKQVNAYFWVLVGTLAFLARQVLHQRTGEAQ